jgi:RHS repeat-associated protein
MKIRTGGEHKLVQLIPGQSRKDYLESIEISGTNFEAVMHEEGRVVLDGTWKYEYVLWDHLGNTRVTFRAEASDAISITYAADYYPYGKILREFNCKQNRYLSTHHERDVATGYDNRGARLYDSEIGRFLGVDPLSPEYPWYTPYQFAGNKPIAFIDLDGLEEFPSYTAYKEAKGDAALTVMDGSDGAWLFQHRQGFQARYEIKYAFSQSDREELGIANSTISGVFAAAAYANLASGNFSNYTTINQRTNFYRWTQDRANAEGFKVRWPGAASEVAANIDKADDAWIVAIGFSNQESAAFANAGNKAIFNDAFPKIANLFSGIPLTGQGAKLWDMQTLAEEQTLIQPLYERLSPSTFNDLSGLAKQTNLLVDFTMGTPKFGLQASLLSISDRWLYGLGNAGYEGLTSGQLPEVPQKYNDGTQLKKVLKD